MQKPSIHIIGINGSGASAAALIAAHHGFHVSGCDQIAAADGSPLNRSAIKINLGHDPAHLAGVDLAVASPALINAVPLHPEIIEAYENHALISWQEFVGEYIRPKYKTLVSIAGTHGKTSTTALLGQMLRSGEASPTILVGGKVHDWNGNFLIGDEDVFVWEADEYDGNFLHHGPDIAVLLNTEWEHPERYANSGEYFETFKDFITTIKTGGTLIYNGEDNGVLKVIESAKPFLRSHGITLKDFKESDFRFGYAPEGITVSRMERQVLVPIFGEHSASNFLAALSAAETLGISPSETFGLSEFKGVERRFQLRATIKDIKIYDDYGHHPSEIEATIKAAKLHNENTEIVAVVEPHQVSRLSEFGDQLAKALSLADQAYITKVFLGREAHKVLPNVFDIVSKIENGKAEYIDGFKTTAKVVAENLPASAVVIVFGAGLSPQLTTLIAQKIEAASSV